MVQNSQKCIGEQDLCSRLDALRQKSNRQGTGTANQQNQRKLSFTLQLFPIWLETVKDTSAENVSSDLVQLTLDTQASASFDFESEEREEIADVCMPAPALERTEEQSTHTPGSRKSTRKHFGKPASSFSDFYT